MIAKLYCINKERSFINNLWLYILIISIIIQIIVKIIQLFYNTSYYLTIRNLELINNKSSNINNSYNFTGLLNQDIYNIENEDNNTDKDEIKDVNYYENEINEIEIYNENEKYNQTIDDDYSDNNHINYDDEYNENVDQSDYENEYKEEEDESDENENNEEEINNDNCDSDNYIRGNCNFTNNTNTTNLTEKIMELIEKGQLNDIFENVTNNSKPFIRKDGNIIYHLSTVKIEKINCYNKTNISTIDFLEIINTFKRRLEVLDKDYFLFKIDYLFDDYIIPIIEYNLFYKNENGELTKLNLTSFKDKLVHYYIPIKDINKQNEFKYNYINSYYNDICYSYESNQGKDIILYDRKDEFNQLNLSLCEKDCIYIRVDFNINKVICECKIKTEIKKYEDINPNKVFYKFTNIKMKSNIYVLKCVKKLFTTNGIKSNIAFYILLIIILISIFNCIYFFLKGFRNLQRKINNIIDLKYTLCNEKINKDEKNNKDLPPRFLVFSDISDSNSRTNIIKPEIGLVDSNQINYINKNQKNKEIKKFNYIFYDNDYEKNILPYEQALLDDNKTYWEYYFSLIRSKHLFVLTFYTYNDYNSKIIKISLFLLVFTIHYLFNALFFNDSIIHKIFINPKKNNFSIIIPLIIYSDLISYLTGIALKLLTFTENSIIEIKNQKSYELTQTLKINILKQMKIKYIIFYSINFILLLFIWYYLSCFGVAFKNSQYILFYNTLISMIITFIFPLLYFLIPGILRISSLQSNNHINAIKYKISQILQFL